MATNLTDSDASFLLLGDFLCFFRNSLSTFEVVECLRLVDPDSRPLVFELLSVFSFDDIVFFCLERDASSGDELP
jgi:hypothetical protein